MANALFDNYKKTLGGAGNHGAVDLTATGDSIKLLLLDTADHTVSLSADEDYTDITAAGIVSTTAAVTGMSFGSVTAGTFDHADVTFSSVTGDISEEILYYKDTGDPDTSPLICRFDSFSSGMPVTPNTGNIDVQVNPSGVFTF